MKRTDCYLKNGDYRRRVLDFNRIFGGTPDSGKLVGRWRYMGGKPGGEEWFVDVKSTQFTETFRLWTKSLKKDKSYSLWAFDFDCQGRRIA